MVTIKTHQKSITLAVIAVIVCLVSVGFSIWGIARQKRAVITQKAQLQKLTDDLTNLDNILSDEKSYAKIIGRVQATLPREYSDVATAIKSIELSAKTNNLPTDLSVDDKSKPEKEGLNSVTITMKTSGSYTDISKFASDLAKLPYHTRIDALVFDEVGGKVTGTITIRLFMQ